MLTVHQYERVYPSRGVVPQHPVSGISPGTLGLVTPPGPPKVKCDRCEPRHVQSRRRPEVGDGRSPAGTLDANAHASQSCASQEG